MTSPRPSPRPRPGPAVPTVPPTPVEPARRRRLDRLDARSWSGALILMLIFAAVLWVVQIVNASDNYRLNRFGLMPRKVDGLWGVLTQPFLDTAYSHLVTNTVAVVLIGWTVMLTGLRLWCAVTVVVIALGGILTWLVAPTGQLVVGAAALVFGWLGYLLARAIFSRKLRWIFTAIAVLFFFGALLVGLFPSLKSGAMWQSHVCAFVAGAVVGAILHPRGGELRTFRRAPVS